jgi:hypothetical protein
MVRPARALHHLPMRRPGLALLCLVALCCSLAPAGALGQSRTPAPGRSPAPSGKTPGQTTKPGQTGKTPGQTGRTPGQTAGTTLGDAEQAAEEVADDVRALPKAAFSGVLVFKATADGFATGRLAVTLSDVGGVTKKLGADVRDALDDQDAIVLVSKTIKVRDSKGRKLTLSALDDADTVTIRGKLLRPSQWRADEDGTKVPTIRAKRIVVTR